MELRYSTRNIMKGKLYKEDECVMFWKPAGSGVVGPHMLGQWAPEPMLAKGVVYPTCEHYMMSQKAILFEGPASEHAVMILESPSPSHVKKIGSRVKGFTESVWNDHKIDIVYRGNWIKFTQLKEDDSRTTRSNYLLSTGNKILIEASPYDKIWGTGLYASNKESLDPTSWRGSNLLGFTLMEVRDNLRLTIPECRTDTGLQKYTLEEVTKKAVDGLHFTWTSLDCIAELCAEREFSLEGVTYPSVGAYLLSAVANHHCIALPDTSTPANVAAAYREIIVEGNELDEEWLKCEHSIIVKGFTAMYGAHLSKFPHDLYHRFGCLVVEPELFLQRDIQDWPTRSNILGFAITECVNRILAD